VGRKLARSGAGSASRPPRRAPAERGAGGAGPAAPEEARLLPADRRGDRARRGKALRGRRAHATFAILELLYASGLRVSELAALELDAVDRAGRTVRVLGKGKKERIVPFGAAAARALEAYLADRARRRARSSRTTGAAG